MANTVGIEITVKGDKDFKSALAKIQQPVDKLNASLTELTNTINTLGRGFTGAQKGTLSSLATELAALAKSARSLRGGNLSGLRSATSAIQTMMNLLNDPKFQLSGNISQRVARWQQFRRLLRSLANALKAFDRIKRPQNIQAASIGIKAIQSLLKTLTDPKFADALQKATRSTLFSNTVWRQLKSMVRHIANSLKAFDRLKRPQNIQAAATAINALGRLIRELVNVAKEGQQLAKSGVEGLFGQRGVLAEGLPRFIRIIANAIKAFGRLPKGTGTNVRNVASFIRSITTLMTQLSGTIGVQGLRETATELDTFIGSLARSMRKLRGIPKAGFGGINALFQGFLRFRNQGGLQKLDKDVATSAKNILTTLLSLPGKLLAGFVNPFRKLFTNLGANVTSFSQTVVQGISTALRAVANLSGPLLRLAKNAGQSIARVLRNAINKGVEVIRFGRNIFAGLVRQARTAAQEISQAFRQTGRELQQIGRTLARVGTTLLVGGGIAGFIQSQAVQTVATFESLMKQIEVLGGVTGDALEESTQFILELGESSVFSASEVAAAFLDLTKSGLDVRDTMAALPSIMDLAAAGQVGVADAASLAIAAIKSFNLEFEDSARVADAFVAAANVGTAEVSDLAAAFPYAASSANAFGQELETTLAAITLLIDTGMQGSSAGRSLATLFTSLIKPSNDAEAAMNEMQERFEMFLPTSMGGTGAVEIAQEELDALGLTMGDFAQIADGTIDIVSDIDGNFRDLDQIIALLAISTRGLTEEQRAQTLTYIAGSQNAGRALLSLVNAFESGQGSIGDYQEAMEESTSAAEVGAALMDTFQGSIEELSGAFETLLIKGITPVIEYGLRPLVDALTFVVRAISALPEPILAVVSAGLLLIPVLATIAGAFLLLTGLNLQLLGVAFSVIGGAIAALINPLRTILVLTAGQGLIVAALGATAFLIPLLTTLAATFAIVGRAISSDRVQQAVVSLRENFQLLRDSINDLLGPLFTLSKAVLGSILAPAIDSVSIALENLILVINSVVVKARSVIQPLADVLSGVVGFFGFGLEETSQDIDTAVHAIIDPFKLMADAASRHTNRFIKTVEDIRNALDFDPLEVFTLIDPELALEFDWGGASFEEMREFLINNSLEWDDDIAKLREIWENIDRIFEPSPLAMQYAEQWLPGAAAALEAVAEGGYTATEAFQFLADTFQTLADNPLVEFLFGPDVTGADLAEVFLELNLLVARFSEVFQDLTDSVAGFFNALADGVPVGVAIGGLLRDIVSTALRFTGLGLEGLEIAFGLDTGGLAQVLQEGNLGRVIEEFGQEILTRLIENSIRIMGGVAGVFADIFDTLFGTSIAPVVRRFFTLLESAVRPFLQFIRSVGRFVRGPLSNRLVRVFRTLASTLPTIRKALASVVYYLRIFRVTAEALGARQATLNLVYMLFGPGGLNTAETVIDLLFEFGDSVAFAFRQIRDVVTGDITVGEFLGDLATGVFDDLLSLGNLAFDTIVGPLVSGLINALRAVDWSQVWTVVREGIVSAATFAGEQVILAWDTFVKFSGLDALLDTIGLDVQKIVDTISGIGQAVVDALPVGAAFALTLLTAAFTGLKNAVIAFVAAFNENILEDVREILEYFEDADSTDIKQLGVAVGALGLAFASWQAGGLAAGGLAILESGLSALLIAAPLAQFALFASIIYGLANALPDLADAVGLFAEGDIEGGFAEIGEAISTFVDSIAGLWETVGDTVAGGLGITEEWEELKSILTELGTAMEPIFTAFGDVGKELVTSIGELFVAIGDLLFTIADALGLTNVDTLQKIGEVLLAIAGVIAAIGVAIAGVSLAVLNGFIDALTEIINLFTILIDFARGDATAQDVLDQFYSIGDAFRGGFIDVLDPIVSGFREAFAEIDQIFLRFEIALYEKVLIPIAKFLLLAENIPGVDLGIDIDALETELDRLQDRLDELDPDDALAIEIPVVISPEFDEAGADIIWDLIDTLFHPEDAELQASVEAAAQELVNLYGDEAIDHLREWMADPTNAEGIEYFLSGMFTPEELEEALAVLFADLDPIDADVEISPKMTFTPELGDDPLAALYAEKWIIPQTVVDEAVGAAEEAAGGYQVIEDSATDTAETVLNKSGEMTVSIEEYESALAATAAAAGLDFEKMQADIVTTAQVAWVQFTDIVNNAKKVERAIDSLYVKAVSKFTLLRTEVQLFATTWVIEFNKMDQAVRTLAETLGGLTGNYTITVGTGTPANETPGGRAAGGPVFAGSLYEVAERGISELLRIGGKTYLIPGQDGHVIPPQSTVPYAQTATTAGGAGYTDNSVVVNEGDTIVQISGVDADVNEISQGVRDQIDAANAERNRELASRLRGAGR